MTFIVTELLDHLSSCSIDFKEDLVRKICTAIELHSQDKKWYIDTLIKVLSLAGNYVSDESISSALNLISSTNSVVQYSVCQIYGAMRDNMN